MDNGSEMDYAVTGSEKDGIVRDDEGDTLFVVADVPQGFYHTLSAVLIERGCRFIQQQQRLR